jgi:aspartyl protease family protein
MPRSELRKNLLIAALGLAAAAEAWATNVYVTNVTHNQVQVIVNGTALRSLRVGDTSPEGVRLLEIRGNAAVMEIDGRPVALGLGQATQLQTTLQADRQGQFTTLALVNGVQVPAVIDTGATHVALNMTQASRMGIDLRGAKRIVSLTANGPSPAYAVTLASVQVGDIVLRNVPGTVVEGGDRTLPIALIGMSFLQHVDMRRSGAVMTLTRPSLQ